MFAYLATQAPRIASSKSSTMPAKTPT